MADTVGAISFFRIYQGHIIDTENIDTVTVFR